MKKQGSALAPRPAPSEHSECPGPPSPISAAAVPVLLLTGLFSTQLFRKTFIKNLSRSPSRCQTFFSMFQPCGQQAYRGTVEEIEERYLPLQFLPQGEAHLRYQQRMAPKLEEVIIQPNSLQTQSLLPYTGHRLLHGGLRLYVRISRRRLLRSSPFRCSTLCDSLNL